MRFEKSRRMGNLAESHATTAHDTAIDMHVRAALSLLTQALRSTCIASSSSSLAWLLSLTSSESASSHPV